MNYSNTNCFGTPLTEDTKCKINHKLVGKFPYFNFSSKCYLEDTKPFKGANRVVLRCSGDALMKAFTPGYMPWFQGIFDFKEFGNCLWSAYDQTSGNKRLVLEVEKKSETNEEMVVYRVLYGENKLYVRNKDMFLSEVDHEKDPVVKQKYRFELQHIESGAHRK